MAQSHYSPTQNTLKHRVMHTKLYDWLLCPVAPRPFTNSLLCSWWRLSGMFLPLTPTVLTNLFYNIVQLAEVEDQIIICIICPSTVTVTCITNTLKYIHLLPHWLHFCMLSKIFQCSSNYRHNCTLEPCQYILLI